MRRGFSVSTGFTTFSGISLLPSWQVSNMRVCVASKAGGWSKWCSISISQEALRGKSFSWLFPQLRPLPCVERPSESDDQAHPPLSKVFSKYEFGGTSAHISIFIAVASIRASRWRHTGPYQQDRISGTRHRRRPL
ncbi:hypothetical protein [Microbispora catharanthi]|uniref:Uncharacterized protein n=1 Tax=Microbispora catharanthi TaxID=1712871 RepID=A0A5N6BJV7_9ACTN|nr:hypothetical protein [Microbispora catharanthi]KAB8180705.1 hypothetical protein FH610_030960 [Microbispora catharanthi]